MELQMPVEIGNGGKTCRELFKVDSHLTTRHRADPTTTRQENILTITLNGLVYIQRQRHASVTLKCLYR
jgi:hypothetical protein